MLIFGPLDGPRISAVTAYPPSSARSLTTFSPSTMSTAGSVIVEPTSPASLSTVRTSSTDALLCVPPQRTIAYTKELSPWCQPAAESRPHQNVEATGPADIARRSRRNSLWAARHADQKEYQTTRRQSPAAVSCPGPAPRPESACSPSRVAAAVLSSAAALAGVAVSGGPASRCADRLGLLRASRRAGPSAAGAAAGSSVTLSAATSSAATISAGTGSPPMISAASISAVTDSAAACAVASSPSG